MISNLYPPHAIGGYEERCRQIIDLLRGRGHEVRVLTSTHVVGRETREGHVHRRLRIHGFFGHPWLGILRLYGLEKHNHAVLREELVEFRPDVVHVWNLGGLSKTLMVTLKESLVPVVYDVSDHWIARSLRADVWLKWWNGDAGGVSARIVRILLRATGLARIIMRQAPVLPWSELHFDRIYFCSDALKQLTLAKGWSLAHAAVIFCGVETVKFTHRPSNDRFARLLWVGRLNEDKDPLTAIRALDQLAARGNTTLTLDLYGRGDEAYVQMLRQTAAELGVEERVNFRSANADEMKRVYADYDALLFTSAWAEPFALTPLEAMAAHLPVVSTLEGGSAELIRHGENALAYSVGDATDLATQVQRLEADPALRRRLAVTAEAEVATRFDLGVIMTQIETYLRESVNRHG